LSREGSDMTRIEALRARLAAATPGLWRNDYGKILVGELRRNSINILRGAHEDDNGYVERQADADFIAHAPQDLRDLLELYDAIKIIDWDWVVKMIWRPPFMGLMGLPAKQEYHRVEALQAILSRLNGPVEDNA